MVISSGESELKRETMREKYRHLRTLAEIHSGLLI